MEQEILTANQRKALSLIASEPNLANFYLTGGTALSAYYLKHRVSDDIDMFSCNELDKIFLHAFTLRMKEELNAADVRFERRYDRNQFFFKIGEEELKVEFTLFPFRQLENPEDRDGVRIDSLRDIGANKVMAILDRFDPKDFADLFFILKERELDELRKDAETKFGITIEDMLLGSELAKVRRIFALPKMIKPLTVEELKAFFSKLLKRFERNIFE